MPAHPVPGSFRAIDAERRPHVTEPGEEGSLRARPRAGKRIDPRQAGGPVLLGLHAAGFSGRTLEPMLRQALEELARRPARGATAATGPQWWAATVDLPGHGKAAPPVGRAYPWRRVARCLVDALIDRGLAGGTGPPTIAVGHSLGGAIALLAEAERPGLFSAVVTYEPVVAPPWLLGNDPATGLAEPTRRRRARFDSHGEARRHFSGRLPFSGFAPEVLDAYLTDGLAPSPTGAEHHLGTGGTDGVQLALDPRTEAEVYLGLPAADPWPLLPAVRCPVLVLAGAESTTVAPPLAAAISAHLPGGELRILEGLDHFGPLTSPGRVADATAEWLVSKCFQSLDPRPGQRPNGPRHQQTSSRD